MSGCLDEARCPDFESITERRNLISSVVAGGLVGFLKFGEYVVVLLRQIVLAYFVGVTLFVILKQTRLDKTHNIYFLHRTLVKVTIRMLYFKRGIYCSQHLIFSQILSSFLYF